MRPESIPFRNEFFEQISDAVIVIDNEYVVSYANPAAQIRYGVDASEFVGARLDEIYTFEWHDDKDEAEATRSLAERGYWRGENIHLTRDGRRLLVESSVTGLISEDGAPIGLLAVVRDVTERKQAEEELRRSLEILRATFDSSFGHVQLFKAIRDEAGKIVDFEWVLTNKKCNDEWGEMKGKRLLEQNPGVIETGIFDRLIDVTETGEPVLHEQYYRHEQFDGWFVQSIEKVDDGCLLSTLEITESKRAEQELRASEEKYRTLFESIGEGFCVIDVIFDDAGKAVDLRFVDVNPAFGVQTGLEDPIGKSVRQTLPDLEEYWYENYGRVATTGEPMRFENEAAPLGRFFEVYTFRVGPPEARRVGVIFNDVSERKRAEMDLRLSEEKYRGLFESMDEGFCVIEVIFDDAGRAVDYKFLDVNPAFERQTGIEHPIGKSVRGLFPLHEEIWFETYGRVALTGEAVRFEHEASQMNRYYDVYAFRVGDPGENHVGVLFNDVSVRKNAEANERERLRLRTLVRGQEDERRRIARDLHDDLGQRFTALRLKLRMLSGTGSEAEREDIEEIRAMAEAIDMELDRLAWDLRPAALDDLGLPTALEQFVSEWSKRTGIPAEMPPSNAARLHIPADIETNLYRIAQEALHNVHKHAAAGRVDVALQQNAGHLRLVIADDGRGFDSDPGHRHGGLGLTSMRERAALINGELDIDSNPGDGTSVHVTVPLSTNGNSPQ